MPGKFLEPATEFLGVVHTLFDNGNVGAATLTPDLTKGHYHRVTCTAATITIAAPTGGQGVDGEVFRILIRNNSGGAVTITWNGAFQQAATAPASTKYRVLEFIYDTTLSKWVQSGVGLDV